MSSLLTSANGIDTAQTGLDVIANNIANVNTVGFRGSQTLFSDLLYSASKVPTQQLPVGIQTGSGSQVKATPTNFSQGAFSNTTNNTDVAISGNGFFALADTSTATPTTFTRAGNFVTDSNGYLRSTSGLYVNGVGSFGTVASASDYVKPTGTVNNLSPVQIPQTLADGESVSGFSIGSNGGIVVNGAKGGAVTVGYLPLATFDNNTGLTQAAGSNFTETAASGSATFYVAGQMAAGSVQGGALENSNVNLSAEFSNMIITQQAFNACAKGVTVSNELLQTAIGLKR